MFVAKLKSLLPSVIERLFPEGQPVLYLPELP